MAVARGPGANPFTLQEIEQARQIAAVGDELMGYLERCAKCQLPVAHLIDQVDQIRNVMNAVVGEFASDARAG